MKTYRMGKLCSVLEEWAACGGPVLFVLSRPRVAAAPAYLLIIFCGHIAICRLNRAITVSALRSIAYQTGRRRV